MKIERQGRTASAKTARPRKRLVIAGLVKLAMPWTRRWVETHEACILAGGIGLTPAQQIDAARAGVRDAAAVRVLRVAAIPRPFEPVLRGLNAWMPILSDDTVGLALGRGIYIREPWGGDRALLVHEFVHVAQYERLGTRAFLAAYLYEYLAFGYPNGALEQEAIQRAADICAVTSYFAPDF